LKSNTLIAELGCLVLALALAIATHWGVYNLFDREASAAVGAACPVTFRK